MPIVELIDEGDLCSLSLLLLIVFLAGRTMVGRNRTAELWGGRIAGGAFIGYAAYGWHTFQPASADDWIWIGVRAAFCSGLALGISWIVLAAIDFLYRQTLALPLSTLSSLRSQRRFRREDERRQCQYEIDQARRADEEFHRKARERQQARQSADDGRRRKDARAAAVQAFSLYAPKIGGRFTDDMLDKYLAEYMSDADAPEDVERRGQELVGILKRHAEEAQPTPAVTTLEELARWFLQQKQQIESLPIDERVKRTHLADLNVRYAELSQNLMEDLAP